MTTSDGKVQVQSQLNQACETPLPELLRIIPKDITIGLQIDHITFGAPYHHIPVGYNCHRAADMIERLTALLAERDATVARLADCERSLDQYDLGGNSEYWLRYPEPAALALGERQREGT
jgi:hypothetical protein